MTLRETFNRIMRFEPIDRAPLLDLEGVSGQAERKWARDEGVPLDRLAADSIPFDGKLTTLRFWDRPPLPAFVPHTISDDGESVLTQDVFGSTVKTEKGSVLTPIHYTYVDAPLRTLDDWRAMAPRFDPLDPRRLPDWWSDDAIRHLNASPDPVVIGMGWGPARGIKNGYMFGFDRFMELLVDGSTVLESVFDFWADYTVAFLRQFIDKLNVDAFIFMEDGMGFRNSTLASPGMFQRIYAPYMRRVTDLLRSHDVDVIGYYSSGDLRPLIPSFLDTGINMLAPLECAASMDAVALRKEYGRDLLMVGGISRQAVMDGPEAIRREVGSKVPQMMESGGYIPGFDDMILPDMTYANVMYCANLVRSCTRRSDGWGMGQR